MSRLSRSHFWAWFKRHNHEYQEMLNKSKKETNYLMNELTAHFRAYGRGLHWIVERTEDRGYVLTITTNGRARFSKEQ
jgi:hypothetical protein